MNGNRLSFVAAAVSLSVGAIGWLANWREAPREAPTAELTIAPAEGVGRTGEPPSPRPAAPVGELVAGERDWTQRYHESADFFALAGELAGAALGGDGRAAHT